MKMPTRRRRTLALGAVVTVLLALLAYVALRSGPLAPVAVTVARVESAPLHPALFGIGTIEARYVFKIGPTSAGRVLRLDVHVGDLVTAGQVLGTMDPVDLEDRIRAQDAALRAADAALREATARQAYAEAQSERYERLHAAGSASEEALVTKQQELAVAEAARAAVREELGRLRSELKALHTQHGNLRLVAPTDGIVTLRQAEPGTTIVAGQTVVELIDASSLWVNVRFDQLSAAGLAKDLPALIQLRSRDGERLQGRVLRVEPRADAVTEETLAKVVFEHLPSPLPPLGEIAEVTVELPALPTAPLIPNAAIQRRDDRIGVWQIIDDAPRFVVVLLGRADLDGHVQVRQGLEPGNEIVVYSEKALHPRSRIRIVDRIAGVSQ